MKVFTVRQPDKSSLSSAMSRFKLASLPNGIEDLEEVRLWAENRVGRALLILGDSAEPLKRHSHFWAVFEHTSEVPLGLAVRFDGFYRPVVSFVSDDFQATDELLRVACRDETIVAISADQQFSSSLKVELQTIDLWLVAPSLSGVEIHPEVESLCDERELCTFYDKQGIRFWCPAMFHVGHAFGIRNEDGKIVCAGGVNFILPRLNYAQIGALVTHPAYRGRSYASHVLSAIRASLAREGISECGLFADAGSPRLLAFYMQRGFSECGRFRFSWQNKPNTADVHSLPLILGSL
jgi:GNAT superfamily N-acetyltransferase